MKKKILLFALVVSTLTGCLTNTNNNKLNIACNLPMTGYIGMYGDWIKRGMEFAALDSQHKLDSLGLIVNIDFQDNKGITKECISISQKQFTEKPDIYMSGVTSQTMAITDKVKSLGIPHFIWSFTPLFLKEGDLNFRTWVNYGEEAMHYIDFCKEHHASKVAILFIDLVGAKEQTEKYIIPDLKKHNPNIEFLIDEYPVDYTNFKPNIIKIKEFNPDVILVSGFKGNIVNIVKEAEAYNINKSKMMFSMDLMDTASGALSPESLEGLTTSARAFSINNMQTAEMINWIDRFTQKYGRTPEYVEAYAYDTYNILVEALQNCNGDKSLLTKQLLEVNIGGVNGELKFKLNGELDNKTYKCVYRNGKLQKI